MLPRSLVLPMTSAANAAIEKTLLLGSGVLPSSPRTEVGFVAAVILRAIKDIAAAWKPLFAGSGFVVHAPGMERARTLPFFHPISLL